MMHILFWREELLLQIQIIIRLAFKNNAPIFFLLFKINNALIDNGEDLDVVMVMYNLLEYSKNYSKTTGNFWNYYRN